jgi:DNA-binding CsgD family transcriptional regulator
MEALAGQALAAVDREGGMTIIATDDISETGDIDEQTALAIRKRLLPEPSVKLRARGVPYAIRNMLRMSDRELDCMLLARAGLPNKLIGRELGISSRTVEIHKQSARGKFGMPPLPIMILMIDRLLTPKGL